MDDLKSYYQYHRKPNTLITHMIGLPLLIFSIMVLIGSIKIVFPGVFQTNFSWLIVFALMVFYILKDLSLGFLTTLFLIILAFIANAFNRYGFSVLTFWVFISTFLLGLIFQLAGHYLEGNKPALLDNLQHLLIAPVFVTAEILFYFGYYAELKAELDKN